MIGLLAAYAGAMMAQAQSMMDSWREGEVRDISRPMLAVLDAANQRLNSVLRTSSWASSGAQPPREARDAELDAILQLLIRTRRAREESRGDLLSVLLAAADEESGIRMSDRQLRDELMTLFGAGDETTAVALTWTWYLLSRHPGVKAKLEAPRALPFRCKAAPGFLHGSRLRT